jgi:ABC-2 type transport system ATP-binding protein
MPQPIQIHELSKRYRSGFLIREIRALNSVTFDVRAGEIFGFLGPNGAGKTTAIKILVGLTRATSGRASVLGEPPESVAAKRGLGFLPESPYFYDHLTARELLVLSGQLNGVPRPELRERVARMLETVKLTPAADARLRGFSRGMLQRVGIAQALLHNPKLVILDEPMGGLDPIGRKEFRDIILGLRDSGRTVFFSSHILQDVEMICDRVAILVDGKLVSVGRLDEILSAEVDTFEVTARNISEDALRTSGVRVQQILPGDDKLLVVVRSEADVEALLKLLAARNGRLISLVPRTRTLEDFFMSQVRSQGSGARGQGSGEGR